MTDWIDKRHGFFAELLIYFLKQGFEIDHFLVHLIDEDEGGDAVFLQEIIVLDCSDFDALGGIDDEDRAFNHVENADDIEDEVVVAGGVEKIEAVAIVVQR